MHLTPWYSELVCHQNSIGSGYCGLTESGLCVFGKLCFVLCKCSSVLLQSIVMSYVDCGNDRQVFR